MDSALTAFLKKNSIGTTATMPVVHSTSAYNAKKVIQGELIKPQPCNVFEDEELTYLFYGRPSYKKIGESQIAHYWELPAVFVMDYEMVQYKRIFPFDTGAFKARKYPSFINMMPMSEFEVTSSLSAPQRLVSAFFVEPDRYFRLRPRDKKDFVGRYEVTATDEEIKALQELVVTYSEKIDDRRFAIELQTECDIRLSECGLMAVIVPEEYCESEDLISAVEKHGAEIIPYETQSLKQEMYYHTIYNILFELYRTKGLVR